MEIKSNETSGKRNIPAAKYSGCLAKPRKPKNLRATMCKSAWGAVTLAESRKAIGAELPGALGAQGPKCVQEAAQSMKN
jgi:hypothetical protein